jgi:glycerol transport system ATP-binding protein
MTVFDNLAFPLRNQGMAEARIHTKVQEIAEVLDLQNLLDKKARNLTADEKQKVSMGRGLVRDDVSAILFDEPLTVIDPHLKWKLRRKLKQIHEQFNITMVYVTHDTDLQASALGFGSTHLPLSETLQRRIAEAEGRSLKVGIRPEFVHVWDGPYDDAMRADVVHVEDLGTYKILTLNLDGAPLKVRLAEDKPVPEGTAYISFPAQWLMVYADEYLLEPLSEVQP